MEIHSVLVHRRWALDIVGQVAATGESVMITGGSLAVIRFGAGQGRLRRPDMEALLSDVLPRVFLCGWEPVRTAVPRRYNTEADVLATEALGRARINYDTSFSPRVAISWSPGWGPEEVNQ